jgi:hypothetical protein
MSLRTALACVLLFCLGLIIAWPLLPADEPPPLDPSAWVEPPPPPPIIEVPGTPGLPPAPTGVTHKDPMKEPSVAAGNSCPGGVCPAFTYQPEQRSSGVFRRSLLWRRR